MQLLHDLHALSKLIKHSNAHRNTQNIKQTQTQTQTGNESDRSIDLAMEGEETRAGRVSERKRVQRGGGERAHAPRSLCLFNMNFAVAEKPQQGGLKLLVYEALKFANDMTFAVAERLGQLAAGARAHSA